MNKKIDDSEKKLISNGVLNEDLFNKFCIQYKKDKKRFLKKVKNKEITFMLPDGTLTNNPDDYELRYK